MFYIGIFEDQIYCRFEGFSNGDISILGQSIQQEEFGYIILPPSNEPFEVNECGYVGDEEYEEFDSELEPYKCNSDSDNFPYFNYKPDKILELGVATDYDFYAAHIDYLDVIAHIHAVVNSGRYELDQSLGIYVCIVAIGIREYPGPAFNGENEFHKYAFIPCANYDMCGLITGKNVFPCGSTTGRRGPNCGGNELDWDGGRFYSKKGANMSRTGQTFYHELGHCLGLGHTPDSCLGRCSSNEAYIMCPAGCGTDKQGHFYDWGSIKNARFRIEKNLYPCLDEPVQQPCLDCSRTYMRIIPELNHVSPPCTSDTLDVTFKLKVDCMGQSFDSIFIRIPKTFFEIIDYDDAAWQYSQSQFNHVFYKPNVGLPPYDSLIHTIRIKAIQDNEHIPVSFNTEYDEVTKLITSKIGVATFIQGPVSLADLLTQEPNLLNESKFHINGVLAWDVNDLDIENKIFIFDQNSGIKIQTGLKVNFKSSNFIGCDYLWNGIELEPNCSFNSFSCKFEDAINAVKITEGNGRHSFKNTIFENNYNGILCHPSPNQSEGKFHFNPDFSGNVFRSNRSLKPISEILSYPLKPIAGITISNASNNVMLTSVGAFQYSRNRFENLENGILAIRSDLALFGGFYFEGIHYNEESTLLSGNAIFSSGKGHILYISNVNQNKTNIKNCHVGIFSENNNFNGHEIDMTAVNYGCISDRSIGKRFVLSQSKISALNHCILLNQCHNGSGAIYSNTLVTVGKDDPENISSAISVLDVGTTSNWRIYNNTIVSMNSSQGIALHNVRNSNILNNHISKTSLVPGSKYSGILLSNSSFNIVNCNHIHAPSSEKYTGLFLLQSTFNKVECNSIFGRMDTHLFTEGDCSSTFLKGNNFYSNPRMNNSSIIVNDFSRIGLQPFHGNQFHHFQDLWNKDNDDELISRSRFSIGMHPAQPIPAILAAGWIYTPPVQDDEEIFIEYRSNIFNYECPQNEENCLPSLYEELPIDLFSKSVIDQHEVSWGDFTSTMSPTSARRLMHDILYHKPTGFDSDTTITSFLDSMSYTNVGAFQSRLLGLDSIGQIYGDQIAAKLIAYDSVYTLVHAFLSSKDSLEFSQADQDTLLSIMNGIDTLNVLLGSTLTDAAQDYAYFRQSNLATYSLNGLSDQDSILVLAYRKLFADMIDTIGLFNRLVQYANITLTDSCYLEYGDGVFILRGLKSIYGNNWHYFRNCSVPQPQSKGIDGDAFNSAPGISRQQTENTGHGLIRIYPNPASDEIIIDMQNLPGMTSISGNVTLMHMNGTVLHSRHLASATTHAIDVSSLAAGMYMLCISKDSDPVGKYFKIFILR